MFSKPLSPCTNPKTNTSFFPDSTWIPIRCLLTFLAVDSPRMAFLEWALNITTVTPTWMNAVFLIWKEGLPWSQRLSFNSIFFHLEIYDAKRWSKRRAGRKRKPLVQTVGNLTFMLAQHLAAVKVVISFWPITKKDPIYNLFTGPGGSVLRYSQINYSVGEERSVCRVYKLSDFQGLVFIPRRDKLLLWHLKWKGKT